MTFARRADLQAEVGHLTGAKSAAGRWRLTAAGWQRAKAAA